MSREDGLKNEVVKLQQENSDLKIMLFVGSLLFGMMFSIAIIQYVKVMQYEKDIVMAVSDVADRQQQLDKWEDFNRTHIPETALPRIKNIEAFYKK